MIQFSKQDGNKKRSIIFMIVTIVLLSVGTSFGQTTIENNTVQTTNIQNNEIVNTTIEINTLRQDTSSSATNMNFVLWFMGSKQDPNAKALPAGVNTKKQFMTSGTEPNRLLIKAFLKKAVNFESATV